MSCYHEDRGLLDSRPQLSQRGSGQKGRFWHQRIGLGRPSRHKKFGIVIGTGAWLAAEKGAEMGDCVKRWFFASGNAISCRDEKYGGPSYVSARRGWRLRLAGQPLTCRPVSLHPHAIPPHSTPSSPRLPLAARSDRLSPTIDQHALTRLPPDAVPKDSGRASAPAGSAPCRPPRIILADAASGAGRGR